MQSPRVIFASVAPMATILHSFLSWTKRYFYIDFISCKNTSKYVLFMLPVYAIMFMCGIEEPPMTSDVHDARFY